MNAKDSEIENRFPSNFGEALQRFTQTDPQEVAVLTNASMKEGEIERLITAFEDAAKHDEHENEFWFARDLQKLLDYDRWENFVATINRAKTAANMSGQTVGDHFREVTKMVELGSGATRAIEDIQLNRYACYLITQNGDARKKPVAFGQTYFAIQTRRQELFNQSNETVVPLSEDEKRVFLRNQIKEHNIKLSSAAKDAGVITPKEFAIFHSQGYQGQYGRTVAAIRAYKGLPKGAEILDHMGSTELAANFFRVTQTEEKLRKDKIRGAKRAYQTHYAVGREVRDAMLKISGIAPEDLPAVESIKNAERRLKGEPTPKIAPRNATAPIPSPATPEPPPQHATEDRRPVDLRTDLWKFALLVMAMRLDGVISTADMILELPKFIHVPEDSQAILAGRADSKFSQIVHNLKSHKTSKINFIFQGYAEDVPNGFKITQKGRDFVKAYFSD